MIDWKNILANLTNFFHSVWLGFSDSVLVIFNNGIKRIFNFLEEKIPSRKYRIVIISCICTMLLLVIIFISLLAQNTSNSSKNKQKTTNTTFSTTDYDSITLKDEQVKPKEPQLPSDYYLFRPRFQQFPEDDINKWFTLPNDILFDQLHQENQDLVRNLLEDAP